MKQNLINWFGWGVGLWLFGYILGIIFFFFMPKNLIGWAIAPFGTIFALLILFKFIKESNFTNYLIIGIVWVLIAIILDYIFLVQLFKEASYYKADVYLYYFLTLFLPIAVGWYKLKGKKLS